MATTKKRTDITLNGKGYRLAPGGAGFVTSIATPFAAKTTEGDTKYSDFEAYSLIAQSDFRGGLGQLKLDETTKYLWGVRVDSRGERVTLGPKLDSTNPTSFDAAGTIGVFDANGDPLNYGLADEPENQGLSWLTLDSDITKVAVPFTTGAGSGFAPDDLSGLQLWLKADADVYEDDAGTDAAEDTDGVARWLDQSGNGNHAYNTVAAQRPAYRTAQVNSLPAIKGDGSNDWLGIINGAPVTGSTARTIFLVVKASAADGDHFLDLGNYGTGASNGTDFSIANNNGLRVYCNNGYRKWSTGVSTTAFNIVCIQGDGANTNTLSAYIDGAALSVSATQAVALNTGDDAALFRRTDTTPYSAGYLAEVIVYNSNLSGTDRGKIESYLGTKYNISITASSNYVIERLWAYIRSTTGFTNGTAYRYAIYSDSAGSPNAAVASATSADLAGSEVSRYGGWVSKKLSAEITLSASTAYWLVVETNGSHTAGDSLDVLIAADADIADVYKYYNGSWNAGTTATAAVFAQYLNLAPDTPPVKMAEFQGAGSKPYVYALAGERLYRILSETSVEAASDGSGIKDLGADGVDMLVVQKAADAAPVLLIALGSGTAAVYYNGTTTWTALTSGSTVADRDADKLTIHDNLFWRASENTTNGVFVQGSSSYTDWATAGTGGPKVRVGDSRFPVKALFSWKSQLYAAKPDGLWVITYADTYPAAAATIQATKVLDFTTELNDNNFDAFAVFQNDLYFSLANGVARYSASNVISSVTPDASLLEQAQQRSKITAMASTLNQLYCVFQSDVYDWTQILSYTSTGWHSLVTTDRTGDLGKAVFVDSGLYSDLPRIWTSSHTILTSFVQPTWSLRRWTFANGSGESQVEFFDRATGSWIDEARGRLYTSWLESNLANVIKDWVDIDVIASNLDAVNHFIKVYYRFEEGDAWTLLGTVDTEPVETLTFPSSTTGRKIQLRFDFYTNLTYESPQLLGFALRYVLRPDLIERFQIQVILAERLELHNGARETRPVATQWADLKAARAASEAVPLVDVDGTTYSIHIDQLSRQLVRQTTINDTVYENAYLATIGGFEA